MSPKNSTITIALAIAGIGHDPETGEEYTVAFHADADGYSLTHIDGSDDEVYWPVCASDDEWVEAVWLDLVVAMQSKYDALAEDHADSLRGAL